MGGGQTKIFYQIESYLSLRRSHGKGGLETGLDVGLDMGRSEKWQI